MAPNEPPSSTVTVRIRTMADDLAAVTAGAAPSGESGAALGTAVPIVPEASLGSSGRRGLRIGLPTSMSAGKGPRWSPRLLVMLGGFVVVLIGLFGALAAVPRSTGTVADVLPRETLAFVSVRGTDGAGALGAPERAFVDAVRSHLVQTVDGLTTDRVADASDVTYVLLPGSSPADPIPALLVRGVETVDLMQAPEIGIKKIPGGLLLVDSTLLGRLEGLQGAAWSKDPELRSLFRGLPKNPSILLGFRSSALASVTKPFTGAATLTESAVFAVTPGTTGEDASILGRLTGSWMPPERNAAGTRQLAELLPASTILAFQADGGALAGAVLRSGETETAVSAITGLETFQRTLGAQRDVVEKLLGTVSAGPGVVGVLPTTVSGVRDFVAVFPLRPGADPRPPLRQLEPALRDLGPVLAGGSFPEAVFEEREYDSIPLRYMNFGASGRALDYAITDDLLLVATSRESMLALVDAVRGAKTSLKASREFSPLLETVTGARWLFMQNDPSLRVEFSPALQVYPRFLRAMALRPRAAGMVEGRLLLAPRESPTPEPLETQPPPPGSDVSPIPPPAAPAP